MKDLVIVGTGSLSEVAHDYFHEYTDYRVRAFSCHQDFKNEDEFHNLPVVALENLEKHYLPDSVTLFVAVGYRKMNKVRQAIYENLKLRNYKFATFIDPNVKTWNSNSFGDNVFILENNVIQPYVTIGNNTILWSGNHIGHHSLIGNHCFISSHVVISGYCQIGDNSFIGVNATLHDGLIIGNETLVGAGAIINRDTKEREVFVQKATDIFPRSSDRMNF